MYVYVLWLGAIPIVSVTSSFERILTRRAFPPTGRRTLIYAAGFSLSLLSVSDDSPQRCRVLRTSSVNSLPDWQSETYDVDMSYDCWKRQTSHWCVVDVHLLALTSMQRIFRDVLSCEMFIGGWNYAVPICLCNVYFEDALLCHISIWRDETTYTGVHVHLLKSGNISTVDWKKSRILSTLAASWSSAKQAYQATWRLCSYAIYTLLDRLVWNII